MSGILVREHDSESPENSQASHPRVEWQSVCVCVGGVSIFLPSFLFLAISVLILAPSKDGKPPSTLPKPRWKLVTFSLSWVTEKVFVALTNQLPSQTLFISKNYQARV